MNHRTSIIIPCFNQADTLVEAIESALNQTVPCELIVINDGSTDTTKFVAMEYEERGVKLINQYNKGLPSARNTGIMNATGEFILPLDADDILEPTCVERIEKVFDDTKADVVSPSFNTFGSSDQMVLLKMRPTVEDFKVANHIGYCSGIRKSALLEVGGYSPNMVYGWEDLDLWFALLERRKQIVTIPEPLWGYRTKANSMYTQSLNHADFLKAQLRKNHQGLFGAYE